ncbi:MULTISPECIES: phosphotriesterase family protein [Kitasatospora]|uniref:Phosphotriesterase n=1 Tax=Kitasatospora cathayae TaxID=3004092 RepID=A0ABY7Q0D4_9ACTN|nr:phosphotriesterase [Kitasatospora sp. HUAS 3-15]WBP85899.1 phosphotriesterase [Kitasatospora sp. HUAS 3-15]
MTAVPTTRAVRTVLGDLDPAELGLTDSHDHLFIRSPRFPDQELDESAPAADVLRAYAAAGGRTLVQWTPWGMGRGADALAELSRTTGVQVVAATGAHQTAHYFPGRFPNLDDPDPSADSGSSHAPAPYADLAERFVTELTTGLPGAPEGVRPGLIKIADDAGPLTGHTRRTMAAAAEAHHATGAPIAVHLEPDGDPHGVVRRLHGRHGVSPDRIVLGHLTRFTDRALHRSLAAEGVFLALDSPSRIGHPADLQAFDVIADLVEAGHTDRLLLGADTTTRTARALGGPARLLTDLAPRLARTFGPELPDRLLVANPAAAFAAEWRTP